jgi:hypothetical protein
MQEILYYTDNTLDGTLLNEENKKSILKSGLPILSISLKPINFGRNIVYFGKRGHSTLYKQILLGLVNSKADYIFFCEHDVLYHPSHFNFIPPKDDIYYYNGNVWKHRLSDKKTIGYDCKWLSQLCANRELLIRHYRKRLEMIEKRIKAWGFEPGTGQSRRIDNYQSENWFSEYQNIDIRHGRNATGIKRMEISEFRDKRNCQNWREIDFNKLTYWKDILCKLP